MVRLDLVTHLGPPLRFPPLPAFLDADAVTAPAIARSFVEHRTTDSSNAGCIAVEQTTGVGSISAGPSIPPSAPPACSKYRGCVFGAFRAWTPVAVMPAGPLGGRVGTARSRTLAWMPGSCNTQQRPTSKAGSPKPDKPGRLPNCSTPPRGPALRDWHGPALPGRDMDATNSRFHGRQ